MMNSSSRYATKKEIDLAYETADRFLDYVQAIHEGLSLVVDPSSVYGYLSEFVLDHVSEVKELQSLKESLDSHFELISQNRRFAYAAMRQVSDDSSKPIQEEFDQLYEDVRDWSRILLYRLSNWNKPIDDQDIEDAINNIPGASFGVEFVGDPFLDTDNWPVLFLDGFLGESEADPRLLDLLREMEEICFVDATGYRTTDGKYVYPPSYLRKKCRLEHSQLLRDLASLPTNTFPPRGSGIAIKSRVANPKQEEKEKDYLYLLDQYDRWQAKEAEKTGRKRFNAKEWLQEYDRWNDKTLAIYKKYVSTRSDGGGCVEYDPSTKVAQDRLDSIIKYAQKMKRERSKAYK